MMTLTKTLSRYELHRDKYQWILREWREGKDKDDTPKLHKYETYYSSLTQVLRAIIDRSAGDCDDPREILAMLKEVDRKMDVIAGKLQHQENFLEIFKEA